MKRDPESVTSAGVCQKNAGSYKKGIVTMAVEVAAGRNCVTTE